MQLIIPQFQNPIPRLPFDLTGDGLWGAYQQAMATAYINA
jgi:hypothetical protein